MENQRGKQLSARRVRKIRTSRSAVWACLCCTALVWSALAQIPQIDGESLAGQKVVLPEAAAGNVAVLVLGFTKASKTQTTAWSRRLYEDLGKQASLKIYQLAVLEDVPRFIRGMVISAIKRDVPENRRDTFIPVLHGEAELKKLVNYKEPDDAYLVILDRAGRIVAQRHGSLDTASYSELRKQIESLLNLQK